MVQNDKKNICHAPYLRNHTSYDFYLWYTCKMILSPGVFFFSKSWFFGLLDVSGVKGQKIVQNDKKLRMSDSLRISGTVPHMIVIFDTLVKWLLSPVFLVCHTIYQELYIISSRFLARRYKIMISPGVCVFVFVFKKTTL